MLLSLRRISGLLFICASGAVAFEVSIHQGITVDSICPGWPAVSCTSLNSTTGIVALIGGKAKHFSDRALDEINKANVATDDILSAALFHPERHFTNEDFNSSTQRLKDLRDQILSAVTLIV